MTDQTQQEQEPASPAVHKRVQGSFDRQGLVTHLEAVGTVLKPGRTLTKCQLEVYRVQKGGGRKLRRRQPHHRVRGTAEFAAFAAANARSIGVLPCVIQRKDKAETAGIPRRCRYGSASTTDKCLSWMLG